MPYRSFRLYLEGPEVVDLGDGDHLYPTAQDPEDRTYRMFPDVLTASVNVSDTADGIGLAILTFQLSVSDRLQQKVDAYRAAHPDHDIFAGCNVEVESMRLTLRSRPNVNGISGLPIERDIQTSTFTFGRAEQLILDAAGVEALRAVQQGERLLGDVIDAEACATVRGAVPRTLGEIDADPGPDVFDHVEVSRAFCARVESSP